MSTESAIRRHLHAIPQGIDAIVADYATDAVLITQDAVFRGLVEIRGFFEAFMANASPELLAAFVVTRMETHGEVAYLLWKAEPFIPFATDTFVVRDDRIVVQTFAMLARVAANA
jgi:ketosteroid isomerase-like protein